MKDMDSSCKCAKPFLKWAGGKKQVINFIEKNMPQNIKDSGVIENYFEPFLGGGAIFFHLFNEYDLKNIYLGDINQDLILTYNIVKKNPKKLISKLTSMSNEFLHLSEELRKDYYYNIRQEFNNSMDNFDYETFSKDGVLRASQMIFLNRTCFNGLYRVNKKGEFNVPMGKYKNPLICDKENILNVSKTLKEVKFICGDYSRSIDFIAENSFFYLDPPYFPIKKNSFINYNSNSFGVDEQIRLSKFCKEIDNKNVKFLLSNSDPKNEDPSCCFFEDVYNDLNLKYLNIVSIDAKRSINSNGKKRGVIKELLIFNY